MSAAWWCGGRSGNDCQQRPGRHCRSYRVGSVAWSANFPDGQFDVLLTVQKLQQKPFLAETTNSYQTGTVGYNVWLISTVVPSATMLSAAGWAQAW
jgi:hypothetical protein